MNRKHHVRLAGSIRAGSQYRRHRLHMFVDAFEHLPRNDRAFGQLPPGGVYPLDNLNDCFFNRALRSSSNLLFHCVSSWAGHASFRGRRTGASRSCHKHWSDRVGVPCFQTRYDAQQTFAAWPRLPRPHRTNCNDELVFLVGEHIVRRAPPSRRCRTECHRSTWHGAGQQASAPRRPLRVCDPSGAPAGHQSCAAMKAGRGRS